MATYFASDVHLRSDFPDRALRFARFVDRLGSGDVLVIGGDLCDFWFATREAPGEFKRGASSCPGLNALARFRRRDGTLVLIAGNHDLWLGPFFQRIVGVGFVPEPYRVEVNGVRVTLVHGHRLGAVAIWKEIMESRWFSWLYGRLPQGIARGLANILTHANEKNRAATDLRHRKVFSAFAAAEKENADVVAFGHIHRMQDHAATPDHPRWLVLGGWHESGSYLVFDEPNARDGEIARLQRFVESPEHVTADGLSPAVSSAPHR